MGAAAAHGGCTRQKVDRSMQQSVIERNLKSIRILGREIIQFYGCKGHAKDIVDRHAVVGGSASDAGTMDRSLGTGRGGCGSGCAWKSRPIPIGFMVVGSLPGKPPQALVGQNVGRNPVNGMYQYTPTQPQCFDSDCKQRIR